MDAQLLEKGMVEELSKQLFEQLKAPLDKRDTDLCEKLTRSIDEKVEARLKEEERKRAEFQVPGFGKEEAKKFRFANMIKGVATGDYSDCEFEREACRETAKRKDMAAGTDTAGGFIVPPLVMSNEMIPLLKEAVIASALGVQIRTGYRNSPVYFPKKTSASTANWVGEAPSSGVPTSDVNFGQMELTPHTVAVRTRISNRLIRESTPAVEAIVREDMIEQMGLAIDAALFNGTGVSNQPRGILQTTGINVVTSFGDASAATAWDKLQDMLYELRKDHVKGDLKWAMHPAVLREFQQMLDPADSSQPKQRRLFDSLPISTKLVGYGFETSDQIPTNDILLGLFSDAGIHIWDTFSIRVSDVAGTAFENLQTQILGAMDVDIGVRRADSFCNTTGMTGATA